MDAKRLFLVIALSCASAVARAQPDADRSLRSAAPSELPADGSDSRVLSVQLDGSIGRPGDIRMVADQATVQNALAAGGGATRDSYRLGTLLLRRTGLGDGPVDCIPLEALHASLLMQDDPELGKRTDVIRQLLSGQRIRVDARDAVAGEVGIRPVLLQDGDLLALPGRSGVVYVATAQGAIVRVPHSPSAAADVYIDQLPKADRKGVGKFVLHYPNGRQLELALDAWRYRPTRVPPGSLIAPDSVCLRSE